MHLNHWNFYMLRCRSTILIVISLLSALAAIAQQPVPQPASARFPNIRASLDDGFFVLAEQQARGVLRAEPKEADKHEASLLLAHSLWGQKRYSEMLNLLKGSDGSPGHIYWRARALFELKQYGPAVKALDEAGDVMAESRYVPSALRLKARMLQSSGKLKEAEAACLQFADAFPSHSEWTANQFELAEIYTLQKRLPEAIGVYEGLAAQKSANVAQRAQLKLAHVLYTQGAAENFETARGLLKGLASTNQTRLAYRIDAYVDLAALEEKAGKQKEAGAVMRQAIRLSPDARQRVPLKLALVRLLLRENNTADALKLLEECRAEAPNETVAAELQLEKARALLQARLYDEANEAYQVYLDVASDPAGLAQAYFGKGLALWELERFTESASALDKAVKELKTPGDRADALFKAGDSFYQAGKFDDAEKRYRSFVTDYPAHANVPNALYQLGRALARAGRRADALATFQGLEADWPASEFSEKAALQAADVLLAGELWEDALAKYTAIGQIYTNSTAAVLSQHQRGLVLYRLGRYADAQLAFEAVASGHPDSEFVPQASYMRGFCLYLQGQVEEAVNTCQAFIKAYPDSEWTPEVIFWLAEQYFNQGAYADAEPLFLRIAADFKGHKLASRSLYWAGRAASAESNYVKAIERYSEVAKTYPESEILPQTRFAQGDALTELGEFARAVLAFEEIIKHYSESYLVNAAWGRKGDCQFSLAVDAPARYAEALNSYQAILDRPSSPMALKLQAEYKIGRCLEKTNVPDKAFSRYMNVVYTFINENVERSPYSVMWFTRSAFGAAALKEKEKAWLEAAQVYGRVLEANVPAQEEAAKRIEKIKKDNWLLFEESAEAK
ncbi:tetratricopeptide repeat protein [Pontiella sulfatireligans]|nr:tetratricopeptide repeat protein [Pontiella sulfatireligans]